MFNQLVLLSTFAEYNERLPDWDFIETFCKISTFSADIDLFWVWEIIIFDMRGGPKLLFFESVNTFPTSLMTNYMKSAFRPAPRHGEISSLGRLYYSTWGAVQNFFFSTQKTLSRPPSWTNLFAVQTQNKSMSGENVGFSHKVWIISLSDNKPLYSVKVLNKTSCLNMHIIYEIIPPLNYAV